MKSKTTKMRETEEMLYMVLGAHTNAFEAYLNANDDEAIRILISMAEYIINKMKSPEQ